MKVSPPAKALLVMAAAHWCACAKGAFTVAVFNLAEVPQTILATAVEKAHMAFLGAHIESQWVLCDAERCGEGLADGSYLEVFVMPRLRAPLDGSAEDHPAGYAMPFGFARPRAYAFYDAASDVAQRTGKPLDLVLACILAHETGHLLGLPHQKHGVMRPDLESVDMSFVAMGRAFSAEEGKALAQALDGSRSRPVTALVLGRATGLRRAAMR